MGQEKKKEQRLKARMLEKQHAQELKAYERGRINYDQIEAAEKPGLTKKQELFEAKKEAGRIKMANAISNNKNVIEQTCDNGHDLYVSRRTKKMDAQCFHCNDEIPYKG